MRLLARGPRAAITSGSVATVSGCGARRRWRSAENVEGLIVAPLRVSISAIMPQPGPRCTPRSPEAACFWDGTENDEVSGWYAPIATLQALMGS